MQADYVTISQLFYDDRVDNSLAEIHGLVTGLLCSGNPEADPEDIGQLFQPPQNLPESTRRLLRVMATQSDEQLSSSEYNFEPMLPPDESRLSDRVVALAEWCDGFTVGFSAGCFLPESKLGAEVREILTDFAQFAGMGDAINDLSDQDEIDYMELVEYVRMATITVYQQLADSDKDESPKEDVIPDAKFLH
jgi:uncharacterized protein